MKKSQLFVLAVIFVVIVAAAPIFFSKGNNGSAEQPADGQVKGASTQQASSESGNTSPTISPAMARELIAANTGNPEFVILDIRTPEEYAAGHIDGAENIDFYNYFETAVSGLNKSKTYLVYCRSGHRSGQALEVFKNQGFAEVYDISGGYENWQKL